MLTKTLFALIVVAGLVVVWFLFLRSTRERWEWAVVSVGSLGLIVLMVLSLLQTNPAVLQTSASTIPTSVATQPPVLTQEAEAPATPSSTSAPTVSPATTIAPVDTTPTSAPPTSTPQPQSTPTGAPDVSPTRSVRATQTRVASTPTVVEQSIATVGDTGGNVRSEPQIEDNIIGFVDPGDEVIVVGSFGQWYLIRLGEQTSGRSRIDGDEGWIAAALLSQPSQAPPEVAPPPGP